MVNYHGNAFHTVITGTTVGGSIFIGGSGQARGAVAELAHTGFHTPEMILIGSALASVGIGAIAIRNMFRRGKTLATA